MMQYSELFQPICSYLNVTNSPLDQSVQSHSDFNMDAQMGSCEFPSMFISSDQISEMSSFPFSSSMFSSEFSQLADCDNLVEEFPMDLDLGGYFEPSLISEIEGMFGECLEGSEGSNNLPSQQFSIEGNDVWSPNSLVTSEASSMDVTSMQPSLTLPREEMEIENELSIRHLLTGYGEAMEKGQRELEEVILRCISEKVSPLGQTLERLAFNLCQEFDDQLQGDYLKQESCKNFEAAFKLFYQIFPYGRFVHYAANSAILEAIPEDAETVHIVDFDIGEGVQLSQLIEAVAQRHKTLKVTTIKWDGESETDCAPPQWRFEKTKKQLQGHARSFGLNLKVEEIGIEDLVSEIKRTKKRGGGREFLAFNCMVGLPHMRRRRSRRLVMEFLRVAKDLLGNSANCKTSNKGIITFGDGDACEKLGNQSSFSSFFDGYLVHYRALLESMESNFPSHLVEARMVMESIFVAPYVSSQAWFQKWEEIKEGCDLQAWCGVEGQRLSRENLMESKEIVGEESSYGIRIGGQNGNEMALEWKGTPLVRVSTWINQN